MVIWNKTTNIMKKPSFMAVFFYNKIKIFMLHYFRQNIGFRIEFDVEVALPFFLSRPRGAGNHYSMFTMLGRGCLL